VLFFRRVGFIAANLIAFCRSKTVSKAVHAPPADGPCRKAGTVCVGVNLISADGTAGVSVAISVRAYTLVAYRACRSAVAITVSADVGGCVVASPGCSEGREFSHSHDAPYPLRRDSPGPPVRVPARVGALTARVQIANGVDMAPLGLRELIALTGLAGLGCGLALAHGDLLFVAVFGGAVAMTIETIRRFP